MDFTHRTVCERKRTPSSAEHREPYPPAYLKLFAVTAWCLSAVILGCGDADRVAAERDDGRLMGVAFQTLDNPFFRELNEGIAEVVQANGDRLITVGSGWNGTRQRADIRSLLDEGILVLFLNPVEWQGLEESLEEVNAHDVPCVIVDTQVECEKLVLSQVVSDNVEAGRLAARSLAKVRPSARIVVLHIPTNKACIDRLGGFRGQIAKHPEMNILTVEDGKGTAKGARPAMERLLDEYPNLNAVFAVNDPIALGAIEAIAAAGRTEDITVVSVDGSQEGIAAIAAGTLYSTSVQFPREIGRIAAQRAYSHLSGNPVEKCIEVPLELVTPENVRAFLREQRKDATAGRSHSSIAWP